MMTKKSLISGLGPLATLRNTSLGSPGPWEAEQETLIGFHPAEDSAG